MEEVVMDNQALQRDRQLTHLQQRFVDAYLGEAKGNATAAAKLAGYQASYDTLRQIGAQNLTKADVRRAIDAHLAAQAMTREETLDRLSAIASGDETGALKRIAMGEDPEEALAEIDPRLIKRIRIQRGAVNSIDIELVDSMEALKVLAKWHNIGTTQRLEVTGAGGGPMLIKQVQPPALPSTMEHFQVIEGSHRVLELDEGSQGGRTE
jgi:hypothetical protein